MVAAVGNNLAAPSLEEVYRSEGGRMLRYVERLVGPDAASDVVHDSFMKALQAELIPAQKEEVVHWLYRIATNRAIDELRRRGRWVGVRRLLRADAITQLDERDHVRAALQQIPADQAVALVLRLHEGRELTEVAAVLGLSMPALKSRLARGRLNFIAAYRRLGRL